MLFLFILGFNRHVVQFQGMRDRIRPKQYYCILRNPMAFDRLVVPMQHELSGSVPKIYFGSVDQLMPQVPDFLFLFNLVGVYAFRVEVDNVPPTDTVQWTLLGSSTKEVFNSKFSDYFTLQLF